MLPLLLTVGVALGAPAAVPGPPAQDSLRLTVVYPAPGDVVDAQDSTFAFGRVSRTDAVVTVNGVPVPVHRTGGWLAWLAIPAPAADSLLTFDVVARAGGDSVRVLHTVRRRVRFTPPPSGAWIDPRSLDPAAPRWLRPGTLLPLRVRATPGAIVRFRLPTGRTVPLTPERVEDDVPAARRAFERDERKLVPTGRADRYAGLLRPAGCPLVPVDSAFPTSSTRPPPRAGRAPVPAPCVRGVLEVIAGRDTLRTPWALDVARLDTLPVVAELVDAAGDGAPIQGRALPGGTYHWPMPAGTRAEIVERLGDEVALRLAEDVVAWVPVRSVRTLPAGTPPPLATAGSATLTPTPEGVALRLPLGTRVPYRIDEQASGLVLRLYRTRGSVNWVRHGAADTLVDAVRWRQERADQLVLELDVPRRWGWRATWRGTDLVLEVRRAPVVDRQQPLRGILVAVDPGHPPIGATGPTGLREPVMTLAVARRMVPLLEARGARVILTRTDSLPVALGERPRRAEAAGAHLFVSIHGNALPDGLNPFVNNGTSVFYHDGPGLALARAVQQSLVATLGLRDLGIAWADLAVVRPTWMPAILCEGAFLMIPEQEELLASEAGQRRYAEGVVEGIERFLRGWGR